MSFSRSGTIFTSAWLLLFPLSAACGSDDDGGGGSGTGGSSTGGSSSGGTSAGGTGGSSTGGSAGSTGGSAGSSTGGSAGSTGGSAGSNTGGSSAGGTGGAGTGGAGTGGSSSGNWTCLTSGNGCTCTDSGAFVDKTCAGTYNCCFTYKPGSANFCICATADATACAASRKQNNGTTVSKCPP